LIVAIYFSRGMPEGVFLEKCSYNSTICHLVGVGFSRWGSTIFKKNDKIVEKRGEQTPDFHVDVAGLRKESKWLLI